MAWSSSFLLCFFFFDLTFYPGSAGTICFLRVVTKEKLWGPVIVYLTTRPVFYLHLPWNKLALLENLNIDSDVILTLTLLSSEKLFF